MECFKCGSEWKSKVSSKVCPFCGEELKPESSQKSSFTNIAITLKYIVDNYGIEVYKNTTLLLAYISDLAPQLNAEKRLVKMCAESGVINQIANLHNIAKDEQEVFIRKSVATLCEQYFLNEKASKDVLSWLSYGVGWLKDSENEKNYDVQPSLIVKNSIQEDDKELVIAEEDFLENFVESSEESSIPQSESDLLMDAYNENLSDFGNDIIIAPFDENKYKELSTEKNYCEAKREYIKENYEKALALFEDSFLAGNFFAFVYIGLMHHYGEGVPIDEDIALSYFKEGARHGCPLSAIWITELVRLGKGYHKKDKELAKKIFQNIESDLIKMCDMGDEQALYFLGSEKLWGSLANQDISLGFKYIQEAYSKGIKRAGLVLGECYLYGKGTETDENKAFELLHQNQNKHSMRGKYLLGLCFLTGKGTNENEEKAFILLKQSAEGGYGLAKSNLGKCYEYGFGTEVDLKEAFKWYKDAADNHSVASAEFSLYRMYSTGNGIEKNNDFAAKYLIGALKQNYSESFYYVGLEYLSGNLFDNDIKNACYWFEQAALSGDVDAMAKVGALYISSDEVLDEKKGFEWIVKAAQQENVFAEYVLAGCYEHGIAVTGDISQANKWYKRVVQHGDENDENVLFAHLTLGKNYLDGNGIEKSERLAEKHLDVAAKGNIDEAKLFLARKYINEGKNYSEAFNLLNSIDFVNNDNDCIGEAYYFLGNCFEKGLGCSKDKKKAKEYYQKADNRGYRNSKAKKFFW